MNTLQMAAVLAFAFAAVGVIVWFGNVFYAVGQSARVRREADGRPWPKRYKRHRRLLPTTRRSVRSRLLLTCGMACGTNRRSTPYLIAASEIQEVMPCR